MKALSLWQPWASLWLTERKIHETRDWSLAMKWSGWQDQWLAVHAAQRIRFKEMSPKLEKICDDEFGAHWGLELPTGAIIGAVKIVRCVPANGGVSEHENDYQCGNFAQGRFAFRRADYFRLIQPIPYRGQQGPFNIPDGIMALFARAA